MKIQQQELYITIYYMWKITMTNPTSFRKNNQIHLNQYDYLIKRYLLNIEREMI